MIKILFFMVWSLCLLLLFYLSVTNQPLLVHHPTDKLLHGAGGIVFMLMPAYLCRRKLHFYGWGVMAMIAGIGVEAIQGFIPERQMSLDDMVANAAGVLLGLFIGHVLRHYVFQAHPPEVKDTDL